MWCKAQVENMLRSAITHVRLNHVIICDVHRDILSEYPAKIFQGICGSNDARCGVFGKFKYYADGHEKQRYDWGVRLGHVGLSCAN